MIECTFLIPTVRDDDKQPHCPTLWDHFERDLIETFGGYTFLGLCRGSWKDSDGNIICDYSQRYSVAVENHNEDQFYSLLRHYRVKFGQQCLYVAMTSEHATLLV